MNKLDNRPFMLSQVASSDGIELVAEQKTRMLPKTGSPVAHGDYAQKLQADIDLIRQDWTKGQGRVLLLAIIPPVALVALTVATTAFGQLDGFVYWIGKGLLLLLIAVVAVKVLFQWQRTVRSIISHSYSEVHLTCPHCSQNIDLTQPWQCGWCGIVSNQGMLLSPTLVFDGCSHKGRHRPIAIRCTHCHHDIIRDNKAYLSEHEANRHGIAGVAEFAAPSKAGL